MTWRDASLRPRSLRRVSALPGRLLVSSAAGARLGLRRTPPRGGNEPRRPRKKASPWLDVVSLAAALADGVHESARAPSLRWRTLFGAARAVRARATRRVCTQRAEPAPVVLSRRR
mmetsp:Transcript_14050/g.46869  ORF Transcript_14050/g.46869 Transcript_14050/m.46869 type:complete len:116 (+) Transcript_14050:956-1303(+)